MTTENRIAFTQSARMAIAFEFKSRHSFKGGRFTPRENIADAVKIIRRMEGGEA
jgi:hypothetical protein